jgi:hypothetical protein
MANVKCKPSIDFQSQQIVRNIVGKCFVGDSYLQVVRFAVSKLRGGYTTYRKLPRKFRRSLLQTIIRAHADNRKLYAYVMHGYSI